MRISRSKATAPPSPAQIVQWTKDLLVSKQQAKDFKARQDDVTKRLKAVVEAQGEPDDQGHLWFDLPEAVDGVPKLQMQRKVAQSVNEDKAEEILKAKGLYDTCTTTVVVLDQDEIMAAHYRGDLTEAELDAMFPKSVSYALMTPKG